MTKSTQACLGIVYNRYHELPRYKDESLSEKAIEKTAHDVLSEVTRLKHPSFLFSLGIQLKRFLDWLNESKPDVILNLCEGFHGIPQLEAQVAGLFELMGIPFTGNSSQAIALCQDKFRTKAILRSFGLDTPDCRLADAPLRDAGIGFPVIVKPNHEDASLGIGIDSVVENPEDLPERIEKLQKKYDQPVLVEKFIDGREFNVAVLEGPDIKALPVSEIDYSLLPDDLPKICSYEAKWEEDHMYYLQTPPVCPANIDSGLQSRLQEAAVAAFRAAGCRDYARVDFRVNEFGLPFILEVNPNPDISLDAGFARALKAAGIGYGEFWTQMIINAVSREKNDS